MACHQLCSGLQAAGCERGVQTSRMQLGSSSSALLPAMPRPGRAFLPARQPRRAALRVAAQQQTNPRYVRGPPQKWEPDVLINEEIRAPEVRLIASDRQMIGVVSRSEALRMAEEADVDVICVNPDADPPLCRLVEYSKFKYELEKANKDQKKKQREARVEIKELKLRPNTDVHDYQVRLRAAEKFIAKGNKVKLSLQFRGREMEFQEIGRETFNRFMVDLGDTAVIESGPTMMGRTMQMVIMPKRV